MTFKKFQQPLSIQKGDKICILSTARAIEKKEIQDAIHLLDNSGFQVVLGKTIENRHHQFAGTDQERLQDFQQMIDHQDIKAIVCARGGYGTARIIDHIDWTKFLEKPKWIVGYSDITALHNTLSQMGILSIHGIMPINIKNDKSRKCLQQVLDIMAGKTAFHLQFPSHPLNRNGTFEGRLTGGNLSMLYSLRGTPYDFIPDGNVLFLEDLDEYLYHVDRMMQNFHLAGVLHKISGLVIGGMTDMNDNTTPFGKNAVEIISDHFESFNKPIAFGAPVGHFSNNKPFICGSRVSVEVNDKFTTLKMNW